MIFTKKWYCCTVARSTIMLCKYQLCLTITWSTMIIRLNFILHSDHFLLLSGSNFNVLYLLIWKCYTDILDESHKNPVVLARNQNFQDFLNDHLSSQTTWYGKTQVTSCKLRIASYELRVESLKALAENLKARVEIQRSEFKSTNYEFK